jgi:hypothetical protein
MLPRLVSALVMLSVAAGLCSMGCVRPRSPRDLHEMSVEELREERNRLLERSAEMQGLGASAQDERQRLMLEVATLRALREVYLGGDKTGGEKRKAPELALPEDPLALTIVQRQSKTLRGSRGTVRIRIGDVTGGQVLVEVLSRSGPPLVDTVSMKPGDVAQFRVAERGYYLTLVKLRNFLIGDDFAEFEVSTKRPSAKRLKAIRGPAPGREESSESRAPAES